KRNWSATLQGDGWALAAREGSRILRLSLKPLKPPVIHGHDGISRKGSGKANASHYYSLTRLATSGVIELDGETLPVSGLSWMDHEFSTSQLEPGQTGWDWVSLQWDDGTEWMLFQLRRADGSRDPFSAGTLIDQAGGTTALSAGEFVME